MRKMMLLAVLLCFGPATLFAGTVAGYLVDSKCFAAEERNVNPFDPAFYTNHDRGYEVLVCRPKAGTTSFTLVVSDGQNFELDATGKPKPPTLSGRRVENAS